MTEQEHLHVSEDERERAKLISEYKYVVDLQCKMVDAKREGIRLVAKNAIDMSMNTDTIIKLTGMTYDEVEYLRSGS